MENGYTCFCSKRGHMIGICISWNDQKVVTDYDCSYPDCAKDCQLLKECPIGFQETFPASHA